MYVIIWSQTGDRANSLKMAKINQTPQNNGSQNTSHWTNDWETRTALRTGEKGNELRYSMINSFCSVSGTSRVTAKPYKHLIEIWTKIVYVHREHVLL